MVRTPVVPNGEIVDVCPSVPQRQVMVLQQQSNEPVLQTLALIFGEPVDFPQVMANGVKRLPAGDGVGSHHRMNSFKCIADLTPLAPSVFAFSNQTEGLSENIHACKWKGKLTFSGAPRGPVWSLNP